MRFTGALCLLLLGAAGCGGGAGGGSEPAACDAARCAASCAESGREGACQEASDGVARCACTEPLQVPGGPGAGLSSGGVVRRAAGGYQLTISVGPVSVGAERSDGTRRLRVAPQPVADPQREER